MPSDLSHRRVFSRKMLEAFTHDRVAVVFLAYMWAHEFVQLYTTCGLVRRLTQAGRSVVVHRLGFKYTFFCCMIFRFVWPEIQLGLKHKGFCSSVGQIFGSTEAF